MIYNILRVVDKLDSSDKVENKLQVVDVCYDIMDTIYKGSRKEDAEQNVLVVEKIVEKIVNDLNESDRLSISAEFFIKILYKYLYKVDILVKPDALLKIKIIEHGYAKKMENTSYVSIIDTFDDLDLSEKMAISAVCKEYALFLVNGAFDLLGSEKSDEVLKEFTPKSLEVLYTSLDEAMLDDEMTLEDYTSVLHSKLAKLSKDIYINKYKQGGIDLSKSGLSNLFRGKSKKDVIPIFVSDIYERTAFINEEQADDEFVKDCCKLLDISEEEYENSCLLPGKVSYLKLTRLMRQFNSRKEEE